MVVNNSMNADFTSYKPGELTGWLTQHVGAGARLLDLSQAGFRPVGGRLFAAESREPPQW